MKIVEFKDYNWRYIRIALSLALMRKEKIVIKNGFGFIEQNYDLIPVYDGLKRIVLDTGAGLLGESGRDIVFNPEGIRAGSYIFDSGLYLPVSEIELFILPSLFCHDFRSVLSYSGVTHSHLSYPTTFLKETLFGILEGFGYYASMNLKRFGFYGSGGGAAESRIYPAEPVKSGSVLTFEGIRIEGVKIFMAKMNMEMASREKDFFIRNIGVDEGRVQIMEIIDADGFGNSIHVYLSCGGVNIILSRDMEFYNSAGDFIFEESRYYAALSELVQETTRLVKFNATPVALTDEVIPYLFMSGSAVPDLLKNSVSYSLCMELLD